MTGSYQTDVHHEKRLLFRHLPQLVHGFNVGQTSFTLLRVGAESAVTHYKPAQGELETARQLGSVILECTGTVPYAPHSPVDDTRQCGGPWALGWIITFKEKS